MASILITGANQGIGYHLTVALLRQGHQVAVLDWETHHLAALQNTFPTQLAYYPVDVRQEEALQAAVAAAQAWQGTPEVVIHNACCCPFGGVGGGGGGGGEGGKRGGIKIKKTPRTQKKK